MCVYIYICICIYIYVYVYVYVYEYMYLYVFRYRHRFTCMVSLMGLIESIPRVYICVVLFFITHDLKGEISIEPHGCLASV